MNWKTIHEEEQFLLLKCISGSRAYGLHTPLSDTDYKGVFLLPKKAYYGFEQQEQFNNETNDIVYYELKRFIDLLVKNNPNILELLATPNNCVLYKHPLMDELKPDYFLSKLCRQTFAGYAQSQIKKARGLNKKITNPLEITRKSIPDFCYVLHDLGVIPLDEWSKEKGYLIHEFGLVKIPHMRDLYGLFHQSQVGATVSLSGVFSGVDANDVSLSSIPKEIEPIAYMSFNKDAYSIHCKEYAQYWEWVEKRNEVRYNSNITNGKNYDTKNMMHTFRLLNMAAEIAKEGVVHVLREDRAFLLDIRAGNFEYDYLVELASEKTLMIDELYEKSDLPELPNSSKAEELLVSLRDELYLNQ